MYEERYLRLWLMSIPFWLLNFFGLNAINNKITFQNKANICDKISANKRGDFANCRYSLKSGKVCTHDIYIQSGIWLAKK